MKKILFNERFGLQQATFDGTKTMTRRVVPEKTLDKWYEYEDMASNVALPAGSYTEPMDVFLINHAPYKVGEIVAIAQRYVDIIGPDTTDEMFDCYSGAGSENKMFVKAEYMPHHIKITDIKVEALAGISDEDCLKEGIYEIQGSKPSVYSFKGEWRVFKTPYLAYKELIDRLNKRGFFESNPIVYAYTYELID